MIKDSPPKNKEYQMIKVSTKNFSQATHMDMEERKVKMECIGKAGIERIGNNLLFPVFR